MKYFVFTIACSLVALCTQAQEVIDTVQVRVQYRATYKHTQEQKETFDDTNLLDIGKHASRFYSQRFEQFLQLRDSVECTTQDPMNKLQFLAGMYGSKKGREYEVYKHIPQKGTLTYTDALHNDFFFCYIIAKTKRAEIENEMSKTSLFSLPFFSCIYWDLNNN